MSYYNFELGNQEGFVKDRSEGKHSILCEACGRRQLNTDLTSRILSGWRWARVFGSPCDDCGEAA